MLRGAIFVRISTLSWSLAISALASDLCAIVSEIESISSLKEASSAADTSFAPTGPCLFAHFRTDNAARTFANIAETSSASG